MFDPVSASARLLELSSWCCARLRRSRGFLAGDPIPQVLNQLGIGAFGGYHHLVIQLFPRVNADLFLSSQHSGYSLWHKETESLLISLLFSVIP